MFKVLLLYICSIRCKHCITKNNILSVLYPYDFYLPVFVHAGFAYEVFDQPTADKLTKKLKASTGKVLVKGVAAVLLAEIAEEIGRKIAAMLAAKTVAKGAAKGGASHTSKAAAKSVPILGLVVGIGFGAWRYLQGDMTGAVLEAVACVPGGGTATSLAIDAGLVARDVYKAKNAGEKDVKVYCCPAQ